MTVCVGRLPFGGRVLVWGPGIGKGAPLGGVENFWSGRWEVRFLGGRKSAFGRERKKVNRWEEPSGSISATGG